MPHPEHEGMQDPEQDSSKPCRACGGTQDVHLCMGPCLMPEGKTAYLCNVCHEGRAHYFRLHGEPEPLPEAPQDVQSHRCNNDGPSPLKDDPEKSSDDSDGPPPQRRCC